MDEYKKIAVIGSSKLRTDDYNFRASNVSSASVGTDIDPVLSIDHFRIRKPKFPPHPHAGFSAITYLFEDSDGEFISRDSMGGYHVSKPGGVIWNVAGRGVIHEEYPKVEGEVSHGLQMFINLSSKNKRLSPHVLFVDGPDIPVYKEKGVNVRIIAGEVGDVKAKIFPPGNITYLDIMLTPEATFKTALSEEDNVLLYMIKGSVTVSGTQLAEPNAATLSKDGKHVEIIATEEGAHLVLIAGKPLKEPVYSHGPFTMNSEKQIQEAFNNYHTGKMGHLESTNKY